MEIRRLSANLDRPGGLVVCLDFSANLIRYGVPGLREDGRKPSAGPSVGPRDSMAQRIGVWIGAALVWRPNGRWPCGGVPT